MTSSRSVLTYDEILRRTVLEPDLSFRPSKVEEDLSRDRFGADWALLQRVNSALDLDPSLDLSDVDVAIDGHKVILTGSVPGAATKVRIESTVTRVEGVQAVDNQLVVGAKS